ncbi:MAG: iron-containing alcohol dehydrogenase [Pseudomonadota bacterium]
MFDFKTVPHLIFETGAAAKLADYASPRMKRPMLTTDKGVVDAGLIDPTLESLKAAGMEVLFYDQVEADPPARTIKEAVAAARDHGADGVIGFGGGSSLDTAKLIAVLAPAGAQALEDVYGADQVRGDRLRLILTPTTAGTGSEVTSISVVTSDDDQKIGVVSDQLYADLAIVDASLTLTAPRHVTAATGIDAMVHAIEAYTSKIKKNPISDALAKEALKLLSANIARACDHPGDVKAREAMALGATLAGQAFANAPVAAVHAMAYPLGALFHVPHGLSNALMLAPVLKFNAPVAAAQYAELADAIGVSAPFSNTVSATVSTEAKAAAFVDEITALCRATGVDQTLESVGVSHNALPKMAEDVMKIDRLLKNNPRQMTYDDALRLYTEVL